MGLGKTIQGVGVAELLAREADISKVLVVCPASLKSQWRNEIHRFCDRNVQLVTGGAAERAHDYDNDCFFTVCNYEQVLRDILAIERVHWDLIILDEGQRIKNWESKTARIIKGLKSRVRPGASAARRWRTGSTICTPWCSSSTTAACRPAFRFFNHHRVVDEKGKVLGYKNLDQLRETAAADPAAPHARLRSCSQLPPRTTEIVRIPATDEQVDCTRRTCRSSPMIARKKYISRDGPAAAAKGAVDVPHVGRQHVPGRQAEARLFEQAGRISTSCSTAVRGGRTARCIALLRVDDDARPDRAAAARAASSTSCGSTAACRRRSGRNWSTVSRPTPTAGCFITTNAGSTGLNLQAANTVINVDLPWNPAVLEQRIARAHRMGQQQPVQVYVLVTEETIEENLLATLSAKNDLALAALDAESDVTQVDLVSGMEELRSRLEVLLGAQPEAPVDVSKKQEVAAAMAAPGVDGAPFCWQCFLCRAQPRPSVFRHPELRRYAHQQRTFHISLGALRHHDDIGGPTVRRRPRLVAAPRRRSVANKREGSHQQGVTAPRPNCAGRCRRCSSRQAVTGSCSDLSSRQLRPRAVTNRAMLATMATMPEASRMGRINTLQIIMGLPHVPINKVGSRIADQGPIPRPRDQRNAAFPCADCAAKA